MKITNIGGASAIIEHNGKRILFDPWIDDGVLYGSWYHFPPLNMRIEDIGPLDYIYISHIHEDHCAPDTLRALSREAEIIVMDREPKIPNLITKLLANYAFNFKKIHRIRPYQPIELIPGLTVDMVEASRENEYGYLIDSGLILKWDGRVLYNSNDCEPHAAAIDYITRTYGKVDLALLPYSGGSGYPACFAHLSHEQKLSERDRITRQYLDVFVDTVRQLNPMLAMPFADQYVIGGSRHALNRYTAHPPCPGGCAEPMRLAGLSEKLLLLNSGQSYDLTSGQKTPNKPYRMYTEDESNAYALSLANRKYVHETITLGMNVPLKRLLGSARARMWNIQKRQEYHPAYYLYLDVPDRHQRFEINMNSPEIIELEINDNELNQPHVRISASSTLLTLMLINHVSWNMADGARFLDYDRKPDFYDPKFNSFINHLIL